MAPSFHCSTIQFISFFSFKIFDIRFWICNGFEGNKCHLGGEIISRRWRRDLSWIRELGNSGTSNFNFSICFTVSFKKKFSLNCLLYYICLNHFISFVLGINVAKAIYSIFKGLLSISVYKEYYPTCLILCQSLLLVRLSKDHKHIFVYMLILV